MIAAQTIETLPPTDFNIIDRMRFLLAERVRAQQLEHALVFDAFHPAGSSWYYNNYVGIDSFLDGARGGGGPNAYTSALKKIPGDSPVVAGFPAYLNAWTTLVKSATAASVVPNGNFIQAMINTSYALGIDWNSAFKTAPPPELVIELSRAHKAFFDAAVDMGSVAARVYNLEHPGMGALGEPGQDIFLWRMLANGMNYTRDEYEKEFAMFRSKMDVTRDEVTAYLGQWLGEELTNEESTALVLNSSSKLYMGNGRNTPQVRKEVVANYKVLYNDARVELSQAFGWIPNCMASVISMDDPRALLPGIPGAAAHLRDNRLLYSKTGQCTENMKRAPQVVVNPDPTLVSMPGAMAAIIHEGIGHWTMEDTQVDVACQKAHRAMVLLPDQHRVLIVNNGIGDTPE